MKTVRAMTLGALLAGGLAPVTLLAAGDEERPQMLAAASTPDAAAGDVTQRHSESAEPATYGTRSNVHNERVWAEMLKRQSEAP